MAAPTLVQVMQGLETRLKTIAGLRTNPYRPDQQNPPFAYVGLPSLDYHVAFAHGRMLIHPAISVAVSKVLDRIDQPALSQYMDITGAKSIHAAIEGDKTLGGVVDDCIVIDAHEADINFGGLVFYGAVFNLKVIASGS